jgi:N-acetylglutamate synthase/N-acetylornithine aminotransferase
MSTGVIGVFLPMDKIANGVKTAAEKLSSDEAAFHAASSRHHDDRSLSTKSISQTDQPFGSGRFASPACAKAPA